MNSHFFRFLRKLGRETLDALGVGVLLILFSVVIVAGLAGTVCFIGYIVNYFFQFGGKTQADAVINAGVATIFIGILAASPIYGLTVVIKYLINLWKDTKNS